MNRFVLLLSLLMFVLLGCPPSSVMRNAGPDHLFFLDDGDTLTCRLIRGGILATKVLSPQGDTMTVDNGSIDRIVHIKSGRDVTDRYIDREALKIELAKQAALAKRAKLEADVAAGKRRKSELHRLPFAVLSAEFERSGKGLPQIALTILNLTEKRISLVRTRVYCFNDRGQPQQGTKGRNHVFDATSRIPIGPGEDFTTLLTLRNHPKTRKAKVDIHYLEFADRTWWKGKVEEEVE